MPSHPLAIEGCRDEWEELALAFCRGAEQAAKELVQRQELVARRNSVQSGVRPAENELTRALQRLGAAQVAFEQLGTTWLSPWLFFALGLAATIGVALLFIPNVRVVGYALLAAAGATAIAFGARMAWQRRQARMKVAACEQEVGQRHEAVEALKRELSSLTSQIQGIRPLATVRAVGRVYFQARIENVGGHRVAVDRSGALPATKLRLADFTYDSSELARIVEATEALKYPPVMLQPAEGEAAGQIDALHGEEVILRDTVTRFASFVGSVPTTDVGLPLYRSRDIASAGFRLDPREGLPFPGTVLEGRGNEALAPSIAMLNETLGSVRRQGVAPRDELVRSFGAIAALLRQYRDLRTTSVGKIHQQLLGAMEGSSWCGVRFYCPKATRNPVWIERRLGMKVDHAHEMPQDQLLAALRDDEEIRQRIASRPELIDKLDRAWVALEELRHGIDSLRTAAAGSAGGVGIAATPAAATYSGTIRRLTAQHEQVVVQYRNTLNEIVFGSRRPLIEVSSLSRLTLDPETGVWRNETAGTEYSDMAEIECTQVLRLHEDLLFPIWRHLWSEKADFRKSELFRTNEQLLRMSEKESEKLISIGNQFRDDMRTTREILKQVQGELSGKLDQIRGTREALLTLNLLGPEASRALRDDSLTTLDVGGAGALSHAEVKETMLALEPQAQAERRDRAVDPIDQIMSPTILFQPAPAEWFRARLSAGRALAAREDTLIQQVVVSV